jgi:hypothetical protein
MVRNWRNKWNHSKDLNIKWWRSSQYLRTNLASLLPTGPALLAHDLALHSSTVASSALFKNKCRCKFYIMQYIIHYAVIKFILKCNQSSSQTKIWLNSVCVWIYNYMYWITYSTPGQSFPLAPCISCMTEWPRVWLLRVNKLQWNIIV